jgi:hypothetical protein
MFPNIPHKKYKVGDLVEVNQVRGTGTYKRVIARGNGIVVQVTKTDDMMFGSVGPINLGDSLTVMLGTGDVESFSPESLRLL